MGLPGTRTWSEIGKIEGKGRSSHTKWEARKSGFPIGRQWTFGRTIGNPPIVHTNVHSIAYFSWSRTGLPADAKDLSAFAQERPGRTKIKQKPNKNVHLPNPADGRGEASGIACLGVWDCPTAAGLAQDLSPAPVFRGGHRVAGYPANGGTCRAGYGPCVLREAWPPAYRGLLWRPLGDY